MRTLEEAHQVDEATDLRDKAEAMAAYARQAKDTDLGCMCRSKSNPHRPCTSMDPSARLFHCARCHCQVIVCRRCDRGNVYANGCAVQARTASLHRNVRDRLTAG